MWLPYTYRAPHRTELASWHPEPRAARPEGGGLGCGGKYDQRKRSLAEEASLKCYTVDNSHDHPPSARPLFLVLLVTTLETGSLGRNNTTGTIHVCPRQKRTVSTGTKTMLESLELSESMPWRVNQSNLGERRALCSCPISQTPPVTRPGDLPLPGRPQAGLEA